MKNIVIIGAGGHAKVVADIILQRKKILKEDINIICFLDDGYQKLSYSTIFGIPIQGLTELIGTLKKFNYEYIIAIGNNKIRKKISEKYSSIRYYTAVHPTAVIGSGVVIGEGTVVMANAVVNACSSIGVHCIINTGSIVEHDNIIGDYVHISPNATLCGGVKIGSCTWIGAGSNVKQGSTVEEDVIVGMGTIVIKNVRKNSTIIGNPAKVYKIINKGKDE